MLVRAQEYASFFENLKSQDEQKKYALFFDENSHFEDPFQKVQGLSAIYKVFENMYKTLHMPSFTVEEIVCEGRVAYLRWSFVYKLSPNAEEQSFVDVSRVEFGENGKVLWHVDYWDAAQNVYEKIPLLGAVLRFIKRKIHA
jgi:hypothetical protein